MSYIDYLTYPELVEVEQNLLERFRNRQWMSTDEILRVCQEHRQVRKAILDAEIADEERTEELPL